ncbi:MAG: hypothetical protein ACE5HI_09880 [bacterium]
MSKFSVTFLLAILTIIYDLHAQFNMPEVVKLETLLSVDKVRKGDEFKIGLIAKIEPEWHINSNTPSEDFLIPTLVDGKLSRR